MRFYVIHRGGVAAKTPMHLANTSHLRSIQRILLSVLLNNSRPPTRVNVETLIGRGTWVQPVKVQTMAKDVKQLPDADELDPDAMQAQHSGQPTINSTTTFDTSSSSSRPGDIILKFTWSSPFSSGQENTYYDVCDGVFGTPRHLGHCALRSPDGVPLSTSIYHPRGDHEKTYWPLSRKSEQQYPRVLQRSLGVTALEHEGTHLSHCTNTVECLLHALLGWFSLFQRGYYFRNFSPLHILKLNTPPTSHKPLNLWEVSPSLITDHPLANGKKSKTMVDLRSLSSDLVDNEEHQKILGIVEELEATSKCAGVTNECKAILINGSKTRHIDDTHEIPKKDVSKELVQLT
ncbi:hypothetical protein BJ165DRAFT_744626 [Panaeolus papilionaceus]|nr:hypothetical protein BJ165DRAFT_744626 [Panaeolus papilionaceus]